MPASPAALNFLARTRLHRPGQGMLHFGGRGCCCCGYYCCCCCCCWLLLLLLPPFLINDHSGCRREELRVYHEPCLLTFLVGLQ